MKYTATACEVLARRIIHVSPPDRITSMMSARFTYRELDGDASDKTSALETAIDSHWYSHIVLKRISRGLLSRCLVQYHIFIFHRGSNWYIR
jgi:hypothetical protein